VSAGVRTTPAVIALGSNLGDRQATLASAISALDAHPQITLVSASSLYESAALKPAGIDPSAPEYLNAVVTVTTELEAQELLEALMQIERDHGRERTERWGDRTLDLDIIDFDSQVIETESLSLPHPRAHERGFVLTPWAEADPAATLGGASVVDLAEATAGELNLAGVLR
jgi:2-amino-4-hydroxy-6-hydroxymethyldihydropteridine diphosphokinase